MTCNLDIIEAVRKELFRRRYSLQTIKTYSYCLKQFMKRNDKDARHWRKEDVKGFLEHLAENGAAAKTLNVHLMALKFALEEIVGRRGWFFVLPCSKVPERLPSVLSKEEVVRLFSAIGNPKHLLMIKLMYSAGLRVSELVHLKVRDLELDKSFGWVRAGKGNKDRLFVLAESVKQDLQGFIKDSFLELNSWLFVGRKGPYSTRSVFEIVKKAARIACIAKEVHPHTLRHSFATHLVENGYDITNVQSLLGCQSPETTMVYLHIASPKLVNVRSPLDDLKR